MRRNIVVFFFAGPACFTFDVKITFDNSDHDGQISINLDSHPHRMSCVEEYQVTTTDFVVSSVKEWRHLWMPISLRLYKVVFGPQIVKLYTKRFSGRGNHFGGRHSALGLRRDPRLPHLFRTLQSGALQGPDSMRSDERLLQEEEKFGLVARRTISVPQFVVSVPLFRCYPAWWLFPKQEFLWKW